MSNRQRSAGYLAPALKVAYVCFVQIVLAINIVSGQITVSGSNGANGTYTSLTNNNGAFNAINGSNQSGRNITVTITANSLSETGSRTLNQGSWTSLRIYPTVSGLSVSGSANAPLIDLSGADNVTIDGRVNASGSTPALTIVNNSTNTLASTIRFINSATNNIIRYCLIQGSSTSNSSGIIRFSTVSAAPGNSNNILEYCNISSAPAGRPRNAIYSSGTAANPNSSNIIRYNNIYNHFNHGSASQAVYLTTGNTAWTIGGNSFYETTPFVPTANNGYYFVRITSSTGNSYTINGNFMGGSAPSCGGSPFTKTNAGANLFYGINISAGTTTASNISNNTIRNINWSNSTGAIWEAIRVAGGNVNVGTAGGNTIGSGTGTGSLTVSGTTTGRTFYGINIQGTGTVDCRNNTIGSITTSNSSGNAFSIIAISKGAAAGTITIANNLIGSTTTSSSINASSPSTGNTQNVTGISNSGTGIVTITGNTIASLVNGTTNSSPSTTGTVTGILFSGGTSQNSVSQNFIRSISVSSTASTIYGIRITSGTTGYYNNIISLGNNTGTTVAGIWDGATAGTNTMWFNTIYIGGVVASGTTRSYALYSASSSNTRDFRNNIFVNSRSTTGGSGLHYAVWLNYSTSTNLTLGFNNYYSSGTGGITASYAGANVLTVPIVPGLDAGSFTINPLFTLAAGASATDYKIGQPLIGVTVAGVTTDYGSNPRLNPTFGAWEAPVNKWRGTTNTSYNTPSNWTVNIPLGTAPSLVFDDAPVNNCFLDTDRTFTGITIGQSQYRLNANGYKVTVKGSLLLSGGGTIDASTAGSSVEFSGIATQIIPSDAFHNNGVISLIINNPANVIAEGTLRIQGTITAPLGRLDAFTSVPDIVYSGVIPQTIPTGIFLSNRIHNLYIENSAGVSLQTSFTVDNTLQILSSALFEVAAPHTLTVAGDIDNNAGTLGLILRSAGNGNDAKLINNTPGVPATVELYTSGGTGVSGPAFHHIVTPVESMSFNNSTVAATAASFGLTNFAGDLMLYDESKAVTSKLQGWQYFDGYGNTTPFNTLTSARGYNIHLTGPDKFTFEGSLNSSSHTFALSYTTGTISPGWNLVGNPYPCNYDLNGIDKLTGSNDGVDNTIYFNNDGGYAYWNTVTGGTTGYSDTIAPMQGFFVKVTGTGNTLELPVTFKTGNGALPSRSKGSGIDKQSPKEMVEKVKLRLQKGTISDETLVCIISDATSGFDSDYDAEKLFSNGATSASIHTLSGSGKYAINTIGEPEGGTKTIIPITVIINSQGTYTITATEFENLEGRSIILKHGNTETTLTRDKTYSFTSDTGTFTDFSLIIGDGVAKVEEEPIVEKPTVWYRNGLLSIKAPESYISGSAAVDIFDLNGRKISGDHNLSLSPGNITTYAAELSHGLYIISITTGARRDVIKIVVM